MKKSLVIATLVAASTSMMAMDLQYFLGAGAGVSWNKYEYNGKVTGPIVNETLENSESIRAGLLILKGGIILDNSHRLSINYAPAFHSDANVHNIFAGYDYLIPVNKVYEHNIEEFMKEALFEELKNNELLFSGGESKIDLQVSILDYQEGNAFKRWLLPGWGATVLKVEATLKENNDVIATSKIDSNIAAGGGYTIGAWKYVYTDVAKKLISDIKEEYAKK